ncbi:MAG TPA: hypothetical protein DIS79_00350 [Bacteroidetes bacterium]|nr:hypothetical protein [Bacteroidota bacterium]
MADAVDRRGDTIIVPARRIQRTVDEAQVAPIIFFEPSSTVPVRVSGIGNGTSTTSQEDLLTSIKDYLVSSPSTRVTVIGSQTPDEPERMAKERVLWVTNALGIDPNRVTVDVSTAGQVRYPQLADEYRSVRILLGGNGRVVPVKNVREAVSSSAVTLSIGHVLTCEAGPCETDLAARINGSPVNVSGSDPVHSVVVPAEMITTSTADIDVTAQVIDSAGQRVTSSGHVVVVRAPDLITETRKVVQTDGRHLDDDTWVLGYFNFDGDEFSAVNPEAVDAVRVALRNGQSIVIIPRTDDLGSPDYNRDLLQRRALAARRLLDVSSSTSVEPQTVQPGNVTSPMERVAYRSVLVRIER